MSRPISASRPERWYATVWRWHFYAGLVCLPFVLWLSATGALYLFKPQIEGWLYAPYRAVAAPGAALLPPSRIAAAGVAAMPGGALHRYVLPEAPGDAVQLLVGRGAEETRLWVHPATGAILKAQGEQDRFMRVVMHLHGELMAGRFGSALVEIAACWTIVMILTGLFLWWPRETGLRGVLWPSTGRGRRRFWRDLHAVTGFWVSIAALFLIATGLPWANAWSGWLGAVRTATGTAAGPVDWSTGSASDAAARAALDRAVRTAAPMHEGHDMHAGPAVATADPAALDRVVTTAATLRLPPPAEITPPRRPGGPWLAQSQAEDRVSRRAAEIADDGRILGTRGFGDTHWIDRAIGWGVAVHEGAWAGLFNQLANLAALLGLVTLAVSGTVLWWRRRPGGTLGAPQPQGVMRHSWALVAVTLLLGALMPLFGATLALAVAVEWLARGTRAGGWLGLRSRAA